MHWQDNGRLVCRPEGPGFRPLDLASPATAGSRGSPGLPQVHTSLPAHRPGATDGVLPRHHHLAAVTPGLNKRERFPPRPKRRSFQREKLMIVLSIQTELRSCPESFINQRSSKICRQEVLGRQTEIFTVSRQRLRPCDLIASATLETGAIATPAGFGQTFQAWRMTLRIPSDAMAHHVLEYAKPR